MKFKKYILIVFVVILSACSNNDKKVDKQLSDAFKASDNDYTKTLEEISPLITKLNVVNPGGVISVSSASTNITSYEDGLVQITALKTQLDEYLFPMSSSKEILNAYKGKDKRLKALNKNINAAFVGYNDMLTQIDLLEDNYNTLKTKYAEIEVALGNNIALLAQADYSEGETYFFSDKYLQSQYEDSIAKTNTLIEEINTLVESYPTIIEKIDESFIALYNNMQDYIINF